MSTDAAHVTISGLEHAYREGQRQRLVFHDAALTVRRGEFVALLGPSGSGKSTLLNLLAGIEQPDKGDIGVGGKILNRLPEHERTLFRRRRIGFVFQFFNLIPTLTVAENLALPMDLNGQSRAVIEARTGDWLERIHLAERAHSYPDVLSGGEQQRVALARAVVHEPELLLADEPTGNLDAATADEVLTLMRRFAAEAGATVIMATHSRAASSIADREVSIDDGRIVDRS